MSDSTTKDENITYWTEAQEGAPKIVSVRVNMPPRAPMHEMLFPGLEYNPKAALLDPDPAWAAGTIVAGEGLTGSPERLPRKLVLDQDELGPYGREENDDELRGRLKRHYERPDLRVLPPVPGDAYLPIPLGVVVLDGWEADMAQAVRKLNSTTVATALDSPPRRVLDGFGRRRDHFERWRAEVLAILEGFQRNAVVLPPEILEGCCP